MENFLKKTGYSSVITSIIFSFIGIIIIANPEVTVKVISWSLGAIFVIIGAIKIISYFMTKGTSDFFNYELVYGVIAIVIGLFAFFYSNIIGLALGLVVGTWIIYSSLMRLSLAFKLRKNNVGAWVTILVIAILMLIAGIYVVFNSEVIAVSIGVFILIYSVMDLLSGIIFMKNVKDMY